MFNKAFGSAKLLANFIYLMYPLSATVDEKTLSTLSVRDIMR